LFFKNI